MMLMKDLRRMHDAIPDNAIVTIDGNYDVNVESIHMETIFDGIACDLRLTEGYSVTKDSVLEGMFNNLKTTRSL